MTTDSAHSAIEDNYNQLSGTPVAFTDMSSSYSWTLVPFAYST